MADNLELNAGSGGASLSTDDVSGQHYQRIKLTDGTANSTEVIAGDTANGLDVDVTRVSGTVTVAGTVTASAGTNLNTSTLALEAGGNLATIAASLGVVDDWDETDRAKVNIIVGQAGVAGGSGTVDATTQRMVLATDVALPAGTNAIGKLASNTGVDIGDVDVTSVVPGTSATSLGKAIDSAAGATDTGVATLVKRTDTLGTLTPVDGDYVAAQVTSRGALWVAFDSSQPVNDNGGAITVDNAGTFAVQVDGSALTSLQLLDDSITTTGSAVTAKGILATGTDGTNARGLKTDSSGELQVDVLTAPVRAATTDTITAKLATDTIQNGTTALTPKFVIIDAASSGDNTILAAVSSKKIRVLALALVAAGTTTVRFESGAGGTALSGQMNLVANTGFVLPFNPVGWFETAATTLLNVELSAAVSVDGCLTYVEV